MPVYERCSHCHCWSTRPRTWTESISLALEWLGITAVAAVCGSGILTALYGFCTR